MRAGRGSAGFGWDLRRDRGGARVAVAVALTVVLASVVIYFVWGEPGRVSGSLTEVARGVPGGYGVGEFTVALPAGRSGDASDDSLEITHRSSPDRILWASIPGESFAAARGEESVRQSSAHFSIEDEVEDIHPDQTIDSVEKRGAALVVAGRLAGDGEGTGYTLALLAGGSTGGCAFGGGGRALRPRLSDLCLPRRALLRLRAGGLGLGTVLATFLAQASAAPTQLVLRRGVRPGRVVGGADAPSGHSRPCLLSSSLNRRPASEPSL